MSTLAPERVTDDTIQEWLDTPDDSDDIHAICSWCYDRDASADTTVVAVCGAVRPPRPLDWTYTEPVTCGRCLTIIEASAHRCWQ